MPPPPVQVTWRIQGSIAGKPCLMTYDPGAGVTIQKHGFLGTSAPPLLPSALSARGAFVDDSDSSKLLGPRVVHMSFGGPALLVHVFEANIHSDCLLGADFVAAHVLRVEHGVDGDRLVLRDGQTVQMTRVTTPVPQHPVSVRVVAVERVVIGAGECVNVAVSAKGCDIINDGVDGVSSPSPSQGPEGGGFGAPQPGVSVALPTLVGVAAEGFVHSSQRAKGTNDRPLLTDVRSVTGMECSAGTVSLPPGLETTSTLLAGEDGRLLVCVRNTSARRRVCVAVLAPRAV